MDYAHHLDSITREIYCLNVSKQLNQIFDVGFLLYHSDSDLISSAYKDK